MKTLSDEGLLRFLDDDCSPETKREIQGIIDRDPDTRARLHHLRAIEESVNQMSLERPSANFTDQVLRKFRTQRLRRKVFDATPWRFTLMLLGLVVAALVVGVESSVQSVESPYLPKPEYFQPVMDVILVVGASEYFKSIAVIILGLITLFLFDFLILKPLFSSRQKRLAV